jgi:hypothetical protein
MAKAGRKRLLDRPVAKQINVPESVALKVDFLLHNPRTDTRRHGAWSALVTQLLREWLAQKGVSL